MSFNGRMQVAKQMATSVLIKRDPGDSRNLQQTSQHFVLQARRANQNIVWKCGNIPRPPHSYLHRSTDRTQGIRDIRVTASDADIWRCQCLMKRGWTHMVGREGEGVQEWHARSEVGHSRCRDARRLLARLSVAHAAGAAQPQRAQRCAPLRHISLPHHRMTKRAHASRRKCDACMLVACSSAGCSFFPLICRLGDPCQMG